MSYTLSEPVLCAVLSIEIGVEFQAADYTESPTCCRTCEHGAQTLSNAFNCVCLRNDERLVSGSLAKQKGDELFSTSPLLPEF